MCGAASDAEKWLNERGDLNLCPVLLTLMLIWKVLCQLLSCLNEQLSRQIIYCFPTCLQSHQYGTRKLVLRAKKVFLFSLVSQFVKVL